MEFTVKIEAGNIFVNGKFFSQLCWDAESAGCAIAAYLIENGYPSCEEDVDGEITEA